MNSVIEDIKDILVADVSLGLTFGTNLHLYKEPAKPDNVVTIFEGPSIPPIGLLEGKEDTKRYERPSLQLRIRYTDPQEAYNIGLAIAASLHGMSNFVQGDYFYGLISLTNGPTMLDWDDTDRLRVVLNFNVQRRLL